MRPYVDRCRAGWGRWLRYAGAALCIIALAGCSSAGSPSGGPSMTPTTTPTTPTSTNPGSSSPGPVTPASPPAAGPLRLVWSAVVPDPAVRPHGGFEHAFLASESGAMILIRNLEAGDTTLVATTSDGADWAVTEVPLAAIPFGFSLDGADQWLQVVEHPDGGPGLGLVASGDGLTWETRGRLPVEIAHPDDSAVNGSSVLVCGRGEGALEMRSVCGFSGDGGSTWESASELDGMLGASTLQALEPLGDRGFLALVEGEREGEAVVLTSSDGATWVRQPELFPGDGRHSIRSGPSVYASGNDAVWATEDGATWRRVELPNMRGSVASFVQAGDALVAVGTVTEPEGATTMTDLVVSPDGETWRADVVPAALVDRADPMIMPVKDGMLVVGDPAMMVGRPVPAED